MNEQRSYDLIIIGTGVGGGTLAYALRKSGAKILMIERGDYLPQEPENWIADAVFHHGRYKTTETWEDRSGRKFRPGVHYYVGGNTKVFGAAFPRLRREDFAPLEHEGGTSPAWPISYEDLEPFYARAEKIYRVHGEAGNDPTDPERSSPYPYPPVAHEPYVAAMVERLKLQGLSPFYFPIGIDLREGGRCIRCQTCDGFPCKQHAKSDAEICCVRPALESPDVSILTRSHARRLLTSADGRISGVEVERDGERIVLRADRYIVGCGAVNSAALLLRSGDADGSLANSSGLVGRNYMVHNSSALMAVHPTRVNPTVFQKTAAVNDFYFSGPNWPYPMGNLQMIGKMQAGMLTRKKPWVPRSILQGITSRSVDWWVMSEDLPDPENRVVVTSSGKIRVIWKENNMATHRQLLKAAKGMMKAAGYPLILTQAMGIETNSHQCGTICFGEDPKTSVLDLFCRTHDIDNLYVVDASFFPASAAVNPALTIAAQALRTADRLMRL